MLRRMVNSHARRFVPGVNLSDLLHALSSVSWTRSSASDADPDSEIANALRFVISATSSSLKLAGGIAVYPRLRRLQSIQQLEEFFRKRSMEKIVVMRFQRPSNRLKDLLIEHGIARRLSFHCISIRWRHNSPALSDRCGSRMAKPMPSWFGSVRLTNIRIWPKLGAVAVALFALRGLQACPIRR